ncbi:MAG: iron-containing alcohol dehydrogenase [Treponema sp.]|jgi:alcohol dehydrogenase YqhD (iron-dependent ADH family)|nr:iron-containing alcohol dehydrogenase [Treponema sp.]
MQNFEYYSRTKIIFGKDTENRAGSETAVYAQRILLHHSGGYAVRSGLIDRIKNSLKQAGVEWVELDGVQPNPRLSLVYKGIEIVKKEKLEGILAVGGGSAIDSAKAIALGAVNEGDVWDFFERKKTASRSMPVGAVVTIPAAGSESSNSCVITDERGPWKRGVNHECNRPVFAILNPELTYTLPPYQTACGVADMMAHIMERYFTKEPHVELTDELCEGALRVIIRNARRIFSGGETDYNARAEIMWAGTLAHNNLLGTGRIGDWACHPIEHELSALFDIAHGAGLAIIYPAWIKYNIKEDTPRLARFAAKVWGVDGAFYDYRQAALEGVFRMKNFFSSLGLPVNFADAKLDTAKIPEMARRAVKFGPVGNYRKLDEKDIEAIYRIAAE